MSEIILAFVVILILADFRLTGSFVRALRQEAPEVLASLVAARSRGVLGLDDRIRYSKLILLRGYRVRLALHPRSRALASWLFLVQWMQLGTTALCVMVLAMR